MVTSKGPAFPSYGILIGKIVGSRPPRMGKPHWLLFVQPGDPNHPRYRVAINFQPTSSGRPPELQYQIVSFESTGKGAQLIRAIRALEVPPAFMVSDSQDEVPRLDFVRGGFLDPEKFKDFGHGSKELLDEFKKALAEAGGKSGSALAVFGTGHPVDRQSGQELSTGYTGVENIHMNQGARNIVGHAPHYIENGPGQDGGIIFLFPSGAKGFFVKFKTQTLITDADGNPAITGISEIDGVPDQIRRTIAPPRRHRVMAMATARRGGGAGGSRRPRGPSAAARSSAAIPGSSSTTLAPGETNPKGYFFADVNPQDASGPYIPDNDQNTYKTPYVMTRSLGHTRGPVPNPRSYPTMDLTSVVGPNPVGYGKLGTNEQIAFDIIGDSGAAKQASLDEYEQKVTDLMARDAQSSAPAFLFHVGDVVYFYGEENYYYSQFYEPFRAYPAPIFAIPGNHDGITYNDTMISLDSFQKAFCATTPGRWIGSGGILRSTMTQPGVYFTLNAPLVSIVGLYSNCGESWGWLDEQQLMFLYKELVRLKALRQNGLPAVILAIHHFPRWFPGQTQKDPNSAAIDKAFQQADFWPDAVICGHAHLYQRVIRQENNQDVPYIMSGAGGYGIQPLEEVGKDYMKQIAASGSRLGCVINKAGYVRATVVKSGSSAATLKFEYRSIKPASSGPDDSCEVNLSTRKLI